MERGYRSRRGGWSDNQRALDRTTLMEMGCHSESGGAGESRTPDTQFRKLLLYPSELQPHGGYRDDFIRFMSIAASIQMP